MILILSDNFDRSTNQVIEWLNYYNARWFRINESDQIVFKALEFKNSKIEKFELLVNDEILNLKTVTAYWYRRGYFNWDKYLNQSVLQASPAIRSHMKLEIDNLDRFIHLYLKHNCRYINSFLSATNDKTYYSYMAAACGLQIPDTIISGEHTTLNTFFSANKKGGVITKAINECFGAPVDSYMAFGGTSWVSESDISNCNASDSLFPSLFQSYTDKLLEIRIFYFLGECYSMAIFSQGNEKTRIDFRNYDKDIPNRNVPYALPKDIESKIGQFMKEIDLDCGSIDMIVTPNLEYYFLEVNPVGQFGMVSIPCNYKLEMKIAEYLTYGKE